MRHLLSIAILSALGAGRALAELPAGWSTNFTAVVEEARGREQPVLVYYTASWCGPCRLMTHTTLSDEGVQKALGGLSHVALDIDAHQDLAEKYNIRAVPTFHILSPGGTVVASTSGYQEPKPFIQWLTHGVAEVTEAVAQQKRSVERLAAARRLLDAGEAGSKGKAVAELLELGAGREPSVSEAATAQLATVVASDPALLIGGLNSPQLAVRIVAANLLRSRLGGEFDIDPWGDEAARAAAVSIWHEKLARTAPAAN